MRKQLQLRLTQRTLEGKRYILRFFKTLLEVSTPPRVLEYKLAIAFEDFDVIVAHIQVFLNSEQLELN